MHALAAQYQHSISSAAPFATSQSGDLFLLRPVDDVSADQHRQALAHLVSLGSLSDYRYIDASPQPAILAIRA